MSKAAIRQLLAERSSLSRDEDEDEESFWDRHKGKIIGGIALGGAAAFAASKYKGKVSEPPPDGWEAALDAASDTASTAQQKFQKDQDRLNALADLDPGPNPIKRTQSWWAGQRRRWEGYRFARAEELKAYNKMTDEQKRAYDAQKKLKKSVPPEADTVLESTNIKHFIKMLGESDYSGADSYLKQIVNDKLQAKISKQYQLQKLY
jgi:hypothetical protein